MNNEITKEEMIKILKDTIYHLRIDRSKSSWDDRDYERLNDDEYYDIACEILYYIDETLSKKRTQKIKKIISKIK
jgi:hypothetical protein